MWLEVLRELIMRFTKEDRCYHLVITDHEAMSISKAKLALILTQYGFDINKPFLMSRHQDVMVTVIRQERRYVLTETISLRGNIKHNEFTECIRKLGTERSSMLQVRGKDNTGQCREVHSDDNEEGT